MKIARYVTVLAVLVLLGLTTQLQAQNVGGQKGKFIRPIGVNAVGLLNFGAFVPSPTTSGAVGVGPESSVGGGSSWSASGGIKGNSTNTAGVSQGPAFHAADFSVTGEPYFNYTTTTSNPETLTITDGSGKTMVLSFNHLKVLVGGPIDAGLPLGTTIDMAGTEPASWNSQLDPSGNGYFSEGAFITVAANQQPGLYVGHWTITVKYE